MVWPLGPKLRCAWQVGEKMGVPAGRGLVPVASCETLLGSGMSDGFNVKLHITRNLGKSFKQLCTKCKEQQKELRE